MDISMIITELTLLIFLAGAAYQDKTKGSINVFYIASGAAVGLVQNIILKEPDWKSMAEGAALGIIVMITAFASRQSIGYGDGLMLIATGIYLGLTGNIVLFMLALIMSAFCAMAFICLKLKGKKDKMPFIPFMLAGYILMMAVGT